MTGTRMDNRAAGQRVVQLVMVLLTCIGLGFPSTGVAHTDADESIADYAAQDIDLPSRNPNPDVRIEDPTGIFSAQQFQELNADLERLARLGTEAVLFVRSSDDSQTARESLAEELRIAWGVESSVGARNGMVLVVSVDPDDPSGSTMDVSTGLLTFPIRQLSADEFDHLTETVALPQIQAGNAFEGVRDLLEFTLGTVIDRSGALTERQLTTLDGDLRRLAALGLPTLVYVRSSDDAEVGDQAFAEDVLATWQADTGVAEGNRMVVVVTVNEENPSDSTIAYAAGPDAFPIRQLDAEKYQAILDEEALPPLQDGDVYLSLAYAIRRAINYAEYSPPEPAPLSDLQKFFQEPLNIAAAVLVQAGIVLYFLVPALLDRRLTLIPSPKSMAAYTIVTACLAIVVGTLGILDRNRAAALAGLGVFLLATVILPLLRAAMVTIQQHLADRRAAAVSTEEVPSGV